MKQLLKSALLIHILAVSSVALSSEAPIERREQGHVITYIQQIGAQRKMVTRCTTGEEHFYGGSISDNSTGFLLLFSDPVKVYNDFETIWKSQNKNSQQK